MIATEHLSSVSAITFDFGNTLVPVGRADLAAVVEQMTAATIDRCGPFDPGLFRQAWDEERDRQFAEDVPELREVDLDRRMVRVLARLRGMPLPAAGERWDDLLAAGWSSPDEIAFAVGAYSDAFVAIVPHPATIRPMLERLASRYRLAILSNWPLAATIDAYAEAAGWTPYLVAIVVSQRVGVIKPDPRIFRAAELALDRPGPPDPPCRRRLGGRHHRGDRRRLARGLPARPAIRVASASLRPGRLGPARPGHRRPVRARGNPGRWPPRTGMIGGPRLDSLSMESRDRLTNIATLLAAGVAWIIVIIIVTTQDPRASGQAAFIGAIAIGAAVGLTLVPLLWLVTFSRHARIAYRGDWLRAFRRGAWVAFVVALFVLLRLENAFSLPIALFVLVIVGVAEATLSVDR